MNIREEVKEDYAAVSQLLTDAFEKKDEALLVTRLRKDNAFVSKLSLVAESKHGVVGYALLSKIAIEASDGTLHESLALAPVAVTPRNQNRGFGKALVLEGIRRATDMGFASVIVLGSNEYYSLFGFQRASKWNIVAPFDVDDQYFMALELKNNELASVSGIVRYSKPFNL